MKNKSTLVTVAMLTTFLSKDHKDYLDLVKPFVLMVLPKKVNEKIDFDLLMSGMKQEFGFEDLPVNVLKKILDRLCKPKNGYLCKNNNEYYLKTAYDSSAFELNQRTIAKSLEDVMSHLKNYFDEKTSEKKVTENKAKEIFINFMDYYGYSVIANFVELKNLTKKDHNNYHVARFIIDEHEKESGVFKSILEIVKGFFVYKAIYFFSTDQKMTLDSKLKKTAIYLDTRLIINALGYHLKEDKTATNELLKLIVESGGLLRVFRHTMGEVAGILTKYARDPLS
ncbi:MAG: hypothetical protein Q8M92_02415, partial [Candidatus Subteraquimicrobiales bacterium]|nr:hypothetical protein [Candidatus Subteraquimicrobiales bacterium]